MSSGNVLSKHFLLLTVGLKSSAGILSYFMLYQGSLICIMYGYLQSSVSNESVMFWLVANYTLHFVQYRISVSRFELQNTTHCCMTAC